MGRNTYNSSTLSAAPPTSSSRPTRAASSRRTRQLSYAQPSSEANEASQQPSDTRRSSGPSRSAATSSRRTVSTPMQTFRMPPSLPAALANIPCHRLIPVPGGSHTQAVSGPPKKSHAKRQPEGHIPRPRNAFILFRCDFVSQKMVSSEIENDHRNISRIAGQIWKQMDSKQRAPWTEMALLEKTAHKRKYPDYKYAPSAITPADADASADAGEGLAQQPEIPVIPTGPADEASPPANRLVSPTQDHARSPTTPQNVSPRDSHRSSSCPVPASTCNLGPASWPAQHDSTTSATLPAIHTTDDEQRYGIHSPSDTPQYPIASSAVSEKPIIQLQHHSTSPYASTSTGEQQHVPVFEHHQHVPGVYDSTQYFPRQSSDLAFRELSVPLQQSESYDSAEYRTTPLDTTRLYYPAFAEPQYNSPLSPMIPTTHYPYVPERHPPSSLAGAYVSHSAGESSYLPTPVDHVPAPVAISEGSSSERRPEGMLTHDGRNVYEFFTPYGWQTDTIFDTDNWNGTRQ